MNESQGARNYRSDIQGLRAFAVAAVVLYHANVPLLDGGYVGVDAFFAISGFLITTHLLDGLRRSGSVDLPYFYARRARRLLPASFVVLALSIVAALVWLPPLQLQAMLRDAIATALYVPNYVFALQGTNYLSETTPSLFQHYWSLGVEEQFYLVFPILLFVAFRLARSRSTVIMILIGGLVAASLVAGVILTQISQPWAFFGLLTRAWELGAGSLAALAVYRRSRPVAYGAALSWLGMAGLVASVLVFNASTAFPGAIALVPVGSTVLVLVGGVGAPALGPTRFLSVRPIQFLGMISYSLYLVHWPALVLPQGAVGYQSPLSTAVKVGIVACCVPVAWLLYRWVETPGRRFRWLTNGRPRRTLLIAAAASILVVGGSGAAALSTQARPLATSRAAEMTAPSIDPVGTTFVPSNMEPSLRNAADDNPLLYSDGCHADFDATNAPGCTFGSGAYSVALFGDSHAAQWFPALDAWATTHDVRLRVFTKSSCPSITVATTRDGAPYTACDVWRENAIRTITAERPDVVLLANYSNPTGETSAAQWGAGLKTTISRLAKSSKVAVIRDTPDFGYTPSICLSAHLDDALACAQPRSKVLVAPSRTAEALAALESNATEIDLTDYLCNVRTCPTIDGATLMYRDAHHLTATFSAELADALGAEIDNLLPAER